MACQKASRASLPEKAMRQGRLKNMFFAFEFPNVEMELFFTLHVALHDLYQRACLAYTSESSHA